MKFSGCQYLRVLASLTNIVPMCHHIKDTTIQEMVMTRRIIFNFIIFLLPLFHIFFFIYSSFFYHFFIHLLFQLYDTDELFGERYSERKYFAEVDVWIGTDQWTLNNAVTIHQRGSRLDDHDNDQMWYLGTEKKDVFLHVDIFGRFALPNTNNKRNSTATGKN